MPEDLAGRHYKCEFLNTERVTWQVVLLLSLKHHLAYSEQNQLAVNERKRGYEISPESPGLIRSTAPRISCQISEEYSFSSPLLLKYVPLYLLGGYLSCSRKFAISHKTRDFISHSLLKLEIQELHSSCSSSLPTLIQRYYFPLILELLYLKSGDEFVRGVCWQSSTHLLWLPIRSANS